jgi:hypothetical protein
VFDLRNEPLSSRHRRKIDRDLVTILILCLRDIKHGQHRRGNNEERRIRKMTSRTDSFADAKYQGQCWVVLEVPILVEKTLRFKCFWIWVDLRIVKDCPEISSVR